MQNQHSLMIQGTASDVGKSIIVAGLCRALKRQGVSVAPFKPQNMALNSAVTVDGGEIGRAQALQAFACGLDPQTDFNPVLLKPSQDEIAQVILQGKAIDTLSAKNFGDIKALAFNAVLESYARLQKQFDFIVIEGAGSPAEINLRKNDIANMGFAEAVDCPVVLVADIDKGGVFAHIVGTLQLLSPSEQGRINGFIINKFRGNFSLLESGLEWLEQYTHKTVFGVLPYLHQLKLDAEDSIPVYQTNEGKIKVKVLLFSRISNHTDFAPLMNHPDIQFSFIQSGEKLTDADLIILPGSKNVRADLKLLRSQNWDQQIKQHLRYGGKLLGICGGFQMLGNTISDPLGVEDAPGTSTGLSLLDFTTELFPKKQLKNIVGVFSYAHKSYQIKGYEIHCGTSTGTAFQNPCVKVVDQNEKEYCAGVISNDQQIIGTYIHGFFDHKEALKGLLYWVSGETVETCDWDKTRDAELERLADSMTAHLNIDALISK